LTEIRSKRDPVFEHPEIFSRNFDPDLMTTARAMPENEVSCTKCSTRSPAGTRQCTNPACRCLLPGNPGRTSEVPNLARVEREGREALSGEYAETFDSYVGVAVADLGGAEKVTQVEHGYIDMLATEFAISRMVGDYLFQANALTPRGRIRTAVGAYHAAVDRYHKLAEKLGLQRREGWREAHAAAWKEMQRKAAEAGDVEDEELDDTDDENDDEDDE
jgi:hypothetical protein